MRKGPLDSISASIAGSTSTWFLGHKAQRRWAVRISSKIRRRVKRKANKSLSQQTNSSAHGGGLRGWGGGGQAATPPESTASVVLACNIHKHHIPLVFIT